MRLLAGIVAVLAVIGTLPGCVAGQRPQVVVRDFLLAWQGERYRAAAAYTTGDEESVAGALEATAAQLGSDDMRFGLGRIRQHGEVAEANFHVQANLLGGTGPRWAYRGRVALRNAGGGWKIRWSPSVIHPGLERGQRLALVSDAPAREAILDRAGRSLLRPTPVVVLGVRNRAEPQTARAVTALARLAGFDAGRALVVVRSAPGSEFVPLVTMARSRYRRMRPDLAEIGGLRHRERTLPLTPRSSFADDLVGKVAPATAESMRTIGMPYRPGDNVGTGGLQFAFQRRLAGTAETKVVAQDPRGRPVKVLARWPGERSRSVRTTLDRRIQKAADEVLAGVDRPASLAAVDASSGEVLAVGDRGLPHNAAFTGRYPPGRVFQLVSSAALLGTGLAVDTRIPCPPRRIVGGEEFRNASRNASARAPEFRVSFATSCTTAFVGLARRLPAGELTTTAARLGVGETWSLPVDAFTGFLPPPRDDADKAAYMIGNGPVRVSPLSMALVAAAADSGTWRPPRLVTDPASVGTTAAQPLPDGHAQALRRLMRSSVESGTASAADLPGEQVYGMSGTATDGSGEDGRTYAWFVGFRGDVAVAFVMKSEDAHGDAAGEEVAAAAAHFFRAAAR